MDKIKQMERKAKFLSLDFFSLLFAVKKSVLRYGIVEQFLYNSEETEYIPAVLIGELPIFINIKENRIQQMLSNDDWRYTPYLCDFRIENRNMYFTHSGEKKIEVVCDLYELLRNGRYSYFSESNYNSMVGGFSNVRKTM